MLVTILVKWNANFNYRLYFEFILYPKTKLGYMRSAKIALLNGDAS